MIIGVFMVLPMLTYAQVTINYINMSIYYGNQSITNVINITSDQLVIPIYQYCSQESNVLFNAYLDPLSNLGIVSVSLVLYNGSFISIPVIDYSPKYISMEVNCSLPIYGVYLSIGSYDPYPLEALVIPSSNITYTLTQGSINASIPLIPGLNYIFAIVKIISISPAEASISNYLTAELSTEYSSINIGYLNTYAEITTYITYSSNIEITANGTTYIIITPYYYVPIGNNIENLVLSGSSKPMVMLTGAPWVKYSYDNCTVINPGIPGITPWTTYLSYAPYCIINSSINPITINFIGESLQELKCNNVFVTTQSGSILSLTGNLTINPTLSRVLYVTISGIRTIGIYLNSIPTSTVTVHIPLISRSSLSVTDELGNPINALIYLNVNGTLLPFMNGTCVYPGTYDIYALVNGELMDLGTSSIIQGNTLKIPIFSNYTLNIAIPQKCPDLNLELLIKYGNNQYVFPLSNIQQQIDIPNVVIGDHIQMALLGNGSVLYQRELIVNESNPESLVLSPRVINFIPMDLLNNELSTAVLNIGNLYYIGPGRYCVPINSSVGMVIYGNDVYVVNITNSNIYVRVWTLGALGIKSLLIILGLLTLLIVISSIVKGLGGRSGDGNNDYVVIN
ncbi:MAG: hypothetical protein ACP5GZ_03595 [Vulcanisaeta sp.]|uniref:hypothetical protein n=1 Tax=Vulcanisaeta sp. TaxID=2020871 RepID=UPI003D149A0D